MSSHVLKQITETSWILQKDGLRIALLTIKDGEIVALGKISRTKFGSVEDLEKFLGGTLVVEQSEEAVTDELGDIMGYPVKHQGAIHIEDPVLPIYKKPTGSNIEYAAGYYAILFKNGWTPWYCPKLSTLKESEFIGPYRTKLEMRNSISQKKREKQYE